MKHDVIAMVGLPARGKTYISKSIVKYLNERDYECRIFNVGEYRRLSTDYSSHDFFSSDNEHALQLRNKFAIDALEDLCSWLAKGDNRVAIYDATNSTKDRREIIYDTVVCKYNYNLLFIESICNKPAILDVNIRVSVTQKTANFLCCLVVGVSRGTGQARASSDIRALNRCSIQMCTKITEKINDLMYLILTDKDANILLIS